MPSLGLEHSCCRGSPMAGQAPFWCQLGLLQCSLGLRRPDFYDVTEQPDFEVPFGVSSDMLD